MNQDWDRSAEAWIAALGERGDWAREHVLDPALLDRIEGRTFHRALDVGCGEGRFCRLMQARGIAALGIDPTRRLIEAARTRDPSGAYLMAEAERLPFSDDRFDLVVSYMTLCDIPGYQAAIGEMARVLAPGGALLIANLSNMNTANGSGEWVMNQAGEQLCWPTDHYLEETPVTAAWQGIRVVNWHRPLSAYMRSFLAAGLRLVHFDEPAPRGGESERQARYRRMPWFQLMEWHAG